MYCERCGAKVEPGQNFCASCGKALVALPAPGIQSRVSGHIRLLAILWLVFSAFRLIPVLFLMAMFPHWMGFLPPDVPVFVPGLIHLVGFLIAGWAVIGFVAAWGLMERETWARLLAIALGCLSLIEVPFGTALGLYTLWVLLPVESEAEYRRMAEAA